MRKLRWLILPVLGLALWVVLSTSGQVSTPVIAPQAVLQQYNTNADVLILDVRSRQEFRAGHVPGAINIPHTQIAQHLEQVLPYRNKEVVVYCESGRRARQAEATLHQAGFTKLRHLAGDMADWRRLQLPTVVPANGQ